MVAKAQKKELFRKHYNALMKACGSQFQTMPKTIPLATFSRQAIAIAVTRRMWTAVNASGKGVVNANAIVEFFLARGYHSCVQVKAHEKHKNSNKNNNNSSSSNTYYVGRHTKVALNIMASRFSAQGSRRTTSRKTKTTATQTTATAAIIIESEMALSPVTMTAKHTPNARTATHNNSNNSSYSKHHHLS